MNRKGVIDLKKCGKILVNVIIACICIWLFLSSVLATETDVVVSLEIGNPVMKVNGINIDNGFDTKPIIVNNRTLVPIRAIVEAFGGKVVWINETRTVELAMGNNTITLVIDNNIAYLNRQEYVLDTAPVIINGRTMLPIRFIAEGFNLGVAWDNDKRIVSIVRDNFSEYEYDYLMSILPPYSGQPYVEINNNIPFFKDYEIIGGAFEYYSNLDELGRCDVCIASVAKELMPTDARESISSITPSGWNNKEYDIINGKYLYNRCHIIGFQLTGENANKKNLITGTRYMNIEGMLEFENLVAQYVNQTGNNVMYRSTPVFTEKNLVADGVLIEAYSIEDNGEEISLCVFCYNVQPNIKIDYLTGESRLSEEIYNTNVVETENSNKDIIYCSPTGKRYHFDKECAGKNSIETILAEVKRKGLSPCLKCADK